MDPATAQKLRATKSFRKRNGFRFVMYNLVLHPLIAFACSLLCSCSFRLPFVKQLLFAFLPSMIPRILSPNCLFVVVNIIIAALIRDSRLRGSKKPSPSREVYDDYVRSNSSIGNHPASSMRREVEVGKEVFGRVDDGEKRIEETMSTDTEKEEGLIKSEVVECVRNEEGEEEEEELPNEELSRRIEEEFIMRVKRQRWLEARASMNFSSTTCQAQAEHRSSGLRL